MIIENIQLFKAGLFFIFGLFLILQSIFNWEFFFNKHKYNNQVRLFGKKGVRIVRFIAGLLTIALTYYSFFVVEIVQ
ncbi:MAG: hypothetical protein K9H64_15925 [Bacteroidales bacterium]|nr:hypothetical protein [Bacteroidales bacterium]MCF8457457.1 hypothetical protein [Bacteroidales bacterium]